MKLRFEAVRTWSYPAIIQLGFVWSLLWLSLVACQPSPAASWRWQRAEAGLPHQATILAVSSDPAEPQRLWVGYYSPSGLAMSENGGRTWTTQAAGLEDNPVFDLLFVPGPTAAGDGTLWAATRDGLFRSVDGGANWRLVEGLPVGQTVFALARDAAGHLYAGVDNAGIYLQRGAGLGWESLASPPSPLVGVNESPMEGPLVSAAILALAVAPDGQQLYAGTAGQGLFASQDAGRTWSATFPGDYVPDVALNPADPTWAVASLRDRLVRTHDGGRSWQVLAAPWARDEVVSLLWLADGTLGAGTGKGRLYRSLDGGDTWVEGGAGLPANGGVLALATAGQRLLAGTWTGLYASADGGQTWQPLVPSLGIPYASSLLAGKFGLWLGTRAGLFYWQAETQRWHPSPAAFPAGGIQSLAAAPSDNQVLYAGPAAGGMYRSDDGGTSWRHLPALTIVARAIVVDPVEADHLYILAAWERVYESRDGGQSWQARWDGLGLTTETASISIDLFEPSTVYVGAESGLYRSRNGSLWRPVAPALAGQTVLALLSQLSPEPARHGAVLYLGATRGIYRSLDNGETANNAGWGQGLENISVTALLADPQDPRRLYAGTAYAGLYQSVDWGETWQPIGPQELAEEVVESMAWGPAGQLFAATPGGVWIGERQ